MEYSDAKISALIDGIYDGSITEYDLPVDLYKAIGEYFQKGLYKGFGMDLTDAVGKDLELLTELRENIWMFSAAKTFQEVKDIGAMMYNENEELRSLKEFNDLGREAYSLWNDTWGTTEYNTAEGQAQSASKWNEIEANKKIFPMLTYSAIDDDNTSEECIAMNGVTAPVDDPIWDMNAPLQHFNCRCVLLQQEEGVALTSDEDKQAIAEKTFEVKNPMFNMNPGKDGYIFKDDHPYFEVEKKDRGFARYNFGLPLPENED